jgi:D-lyxose ketol-isomerase
MLTDLEQKKIRKKAIEMFNRAGIALSEDEKKNKIRIADYQPDNFYELGIVILTTVNTHRYCGRYIIFFPGQSCAQHWHPDVDGTPGKEETFMVLWGKVYAYVEGKLTLKIKAKIPEGKEQYFSCRKELIMNPGDQYTLKLHEKHWFQGGPEGAIAFEVSSQARDEFDLCSDPTLNGVNY